MISEQLHLAGFWWPEDTAIVGREAIHTGLAERRGGDYFGTLLNRAARPTSAAHRKQIVLPRLSLDKMKTNLEAGRVTKNILVGSY